MCVSILVNAFGKSGFIRRVEMENLLNKSEQNISSPVRRRDMSLFESILLLYCIIQYNPYRNTIQTIQSVLPLLSCLCY